MGKNYYTIGIFLRREILIVINSHMTVPPENSKKTEKNLHREFELIIESLNCLQDSYFSIVDASGKIIFLSHGFEEIDGYQVNQVIGKNVLDVYKLGNENSVHMIAINEKRVLKNRLLNYLSSDGKPVKLLMDIHPVFSGNEVIGSVAVSFDKSKTQILSDRVMELQKALSQQIKKNSQNGADFCFDDIIGSSEIMRNVINMAKRVASTESRVMILGETGTGKELLAHSIHNHSPRSSGPFVAINCSAIPDTLLESILFGTTKGAFTGAENKPGLFEEANNGTLFLDEINSMNIMLQSKLLRALETNRIRRLGSNKEIPINARIISAMNMDPKEAIESEKMRSDFFYRLAVVTLESPPLRKREGDILTLSWYYIKKYNKKMGRKINEISPEVVNILENYNWPGNVRELSHCIEHAMNMVEPTQTSLLVEHLPGFLQIKNKNENVFSVNLDHGSNDYNQLMAQFERKLLIDALKKNNGNISQTAKKLNLSRQNLFYKLKRLRIDIKQDIQIC